MGPCLHHQPRRKRNGLGSARVLAVLAVLAVLSSCRLGIPGPLRGLIIYLPNSELTEYELTEYELTEGELPLAMLFVRHSPIDM